jgi:imidazolonepropionase-like amidohydrolase
LTLTAIYADGLLDPATGEVTRPAVVLAEDGRIRARGRPETVSVPADATRIDAEGLTLLPGLIDCHVHLATHGEGLDWNEMLATPVSQPSATLASPRPRCGSRSTTATFRGPER